MDIASYLNEIRDLANSGKATEHSYRPALERLFKSIDENLNKEIIKFKTGDYSKKIRLHQPSPYLARQHSRSRVRLLP